MCISFFSCTNKYEEEIDNCLSRIEDNSMYDRPLTGSISVTSCINGNIETIKKVIKKSNYKILYNPKFSEYSQRYEKVLKKYYENAFSEITGNLNDENKYCLRYNHNYSYNDCLHYLPEYRVDELHLTYYSGMRYYKIAQKLVEIYSVSTTISMWHYRYDNYRNYYPSMDGIEQCKEEIIAHLKDDRYYLNKEYKLNNGDYLKQKECADKIETLTDMIKKLNELYFYHIGF